MSIVLHEDQPDEPAEPADPWEHEPLPAVYADDYPIDEPPALPSESERAARTWAAGRLGG